MFSTMAYRSIPHLFDLGVSLDVDLAAPVLVQLDRLHGVQGHVAGHVGPLAQELGAQAGVDDGQDGTAV